MNREEIIRMAEEAGAIHYWHLSNLERFAALVAAAERKAMMQLFTDPENQPTQHGTVTVEYMQREIAAEREACAKVCDRYANFGTDHEAGAALNIQDAIRARGQE